MFLLNMLHLNHGSDLSSKYAGSQYEKWNATETDAVVKHFWPWVSGEVTQGLPGEILF